MALVNSTDSMTGGRTQARGRWYRQLYVWVLIGMVLGAATGLIAPKYSRRPSPQPVLDLAVPALSMASMAP